MVAWHAFWTFGGIDQVESCLTGCVRVRFKDGAHGRKTH